MHTALAQFWVNPTSD